MAEKLKIQHILLAKKDARDPLTAIESVGKNGDVKTVDATMENADKFFTFDPDDPAALKKIMSNFHAGFMNGLDYTLYQVPLESFENDKLRLEEALALPAETNESRNLLQFYRTDSDTPRPSNAVFAPKVTTPAKVLLIKGENGKMGVVAGVDEKTGKVKTVAPKRENAANFLDFNSSGNFFENFIKKFGEQLKNPSHTGFYVVTADAVEKIGAFIEKIATANPEDKALNPYRVDNEGNIQEPEQGRFQAFDLNRLDWNDVEKLGLLGDDLTGAVNGGEATLKRLFSVIGDVFDFEVNEFSRAFMGIKNRVNGDRTSFLDKLKRGLIHRMEQADRKPPKR